MMRIGRYTVGVCQIADCDRMATIKIFTVRYRSAVTVRGSEFKFNLCSDHYFGWPETVNGMIMRTEKVSRET
jgi:hypothetical protein